jgi:hypothetical protein
VPSTTRSRCSDWSRQSTDRHVEIGVGLGALEAVAVGEMLDLLLDDLEPGIADGGVVLEHRLAIHRVVLGAPLVERDVGVQPDRLPALAAGDIPQHAVLHAIAAVAAQILGVNIDADAKPVFAHR